MIFAVLTIAEHSLVGKIQGVIAVDGKTLRGSREASSDLEAIHMISAFAAQNELILGDRCRIRKDHGAENMSILRRAVQNMVKLENSKKLSTNKKRTLAAVNLEYRLKLMGLAETI